ncbi:cytb5 [Trypoxylus dichotomus]
MVKKYNWKDIKNHNSESSAWIVIHNNVYDVTQYLIQHPGGKEILLENAGTDCTEMFESVQHSKKARNELAELKIGEVIDNDRNPKG